MKIKLIAQGSTKWQRFIKRWGVSFLVGEDILFDTFGDPATLRNNLKKFHIDKHFIRHIVLSHDHWDHTMGLYDFAMAYKNITVYQLKDFSYETRKHINFCAVKAVDSDMTLQLKENIFLSGKIDGSYAGKDICEQALVVKTDSGLVLLVGCSHPGIVEMVKIVNQRFNSKVCLVAGGLRLKDDSRMVVEDIARKLKDMGVMRIAPVHCTGHMAQGVLRKMFGENYICLKEGMDIDID